MQTADYCPTYSAEAISCYNFPVTQYPSIFNSTIQEDYSIESKCIELRNTIRPACFHTTCNLENYTIGIRVNENETVTCEHDGQEIVFGEVTIICPRLAVVCPKFTCPGNCSGKGKCDLGREKPTCVCYDPEDLSDGCTESIEIIPPKIKFMKDGENCGCTIRSRFGFLVLVVCFLTFVLS